MIRTAIAMLALTLPAAAQTAVQRDVLEFVETCQAGTARDADGRREAVQAAICLSYIQGFKDGITSTAATPKFCVPPKTLFGDQVAAFVRWANLRRGTLAGPKQAELLHFFEDTYPCPR